MTSTQLTTQSPTAAVHGRERRRTPRYSLQEPAQIELSSWAALIDLYTKDISHDGVFIQTPSPPPVHTKLAIHLLLPDGTGRIRFKGEVVHVVTSEQAGPHGCAGFGAQFMGMTQQSRDILERIVAEARAREATPEAIGPAIRRLVGRTSPPEPSKCQRLRAVLDAMHGRGDATLLGLTAGATLEQVDRAFERLTQRWHPQRHPQGTTPEQLQLIQAIYGRIEGAYRRLRASVAPPVPPRPAPRTTATSVPQTTTWKPPMRRGPSAQTEHRRLVSTALGHLREKRFDEAVELLSSALRLRPGHAKTEVLRAFALARQAVHARDLPGDAGPERGARRGSPHPPAGRGRALPSGPCGASCPPRRTRCASGRSAPDPRRT